MAAIMILIFYWGGINIAVCKPVHWSCFLDVGYGLRVSCYILGRYFDYSNMDIEDDDAEDDEDEDRDEDYFEKANPTPAKLPKG